MTVEIRAGVPADAADLAEIHQASRAAAMPWLPVIHGPEQVLRFFQMHVLARTSVSVLLAQSLPAAFLSSTPGWVEHLYVAPARWRRGYGARLLTLAKQQSDRLQLWTFQENLSARAFYAAMGFAEIEFTDGNANEERMPDVRLVWQRLADADA